MTWRICGVTRKYDMRNLWRTSHRFQSSFLLRTRSCFFSLCFLFFVCFVLYLFHRFPWASFLSWLQPYVFITENAGYRWHKYFWRVSMKTSEDYNVIYPQGTQRPIAWMYLYFVLLLLDTPLCSHNIQCFECKNEILFCNFS